MPPVQPPSGSVTRPSNGVSWQIDIPKLASLVAMLGMSGLKSLQLSGVDIHTVACILALGEVAPACVEFRNALHICRKNQRKETWWLHSLVEYGSGTNFVIDELLKTRAGENVLALITAIASVFEESFGAVLTALYDKLKVPPHSTPSLGQLERLRSVCLPLVREMNFKDRLAETQIWITTLFEAQFLPDPRNSPSFHDPYPDSDTMAELVVTLTKIAREWEGNKTVLAYYGRDGAAWVMTYAWNVLRLPVCVIGSDGKPNYVFSEIPPSSCPVILYPAVPGPYKLLQHVDGASDVIVLSNERSHSKLFTNWPISCGGVQGVDVVQILCGWDLTNRQELGNISYTIAHELIQFRIVRTGVMLENSFYGRNMDILSEALERILVRLGLPGQFSRIPDWRKLHITKMELPQNIDSRDIINLDMYSRMISYDDSTLEICPLKHGRLRPPEMKCRPSFCVRCRVQSAILNLAYLSSTLAFTDWGVHFDMLSTTNLGRGSASSWFDNLVDWTPGTAPLDEQTDTLRILDLDHTALAKQVCEICSGSANARDKVTSNAYKFLGLDLDGMLLILHRAIETSLQPGPVLIVRTGEFNIHGDCRTVLTEDDTIMNGSTKIDPALNSIKPWDQFAGSRLSVKASLLKDSIRLAYILEHPIPGPNADAFRLGGTVLVTHIQQALQYLHVTSPCQHSTEHSMPVAKVSFTPEPGFSTIGWCDNTDRLWLIEPNIVTHVLSNAQVGEYSICHYIPTATNSLAQWAAVSSLDTSLDHDEEMENFAIVQERACICCARNQAEQWKTYEAGQIFMLSG